VEDQPAAGVMNRVDRQKFYRGSQLRNGSSATGEVADVGDSGE